ncbi:MAG: hypothetical protein QM704_09785 [Anaeromyxobacteraceae bacterium]
MGTRSKRKRSAARARLDARSLVTLEVVCDGPARGWVHTHGLAALGHPELEIRGVPMFLGHAAAQVLGDLVDYLVNDATHPLLAGQNVGLARASFQVVEGHPDEAAGYDAYHYVDPRLTLVDLPPHPLDCDECVAEAAAREAARSGLPS